MKIEMKTFMSNLVARKRMCGECPFRKDSLKGWLGGETVDETLNAQQFEHLFSCHKNRTEDQKLNLELIKDGQQPICRGFLVSAKLSAKMFGQNVANGAELKRLTNEMVISEEEKENTLKRWEFREHHTLK